MLCRVALGTQCSQCSQCYAAQHSYVPKPGTHVHELEFPDYLSDASLCVVAIIKEYLERTKHLRKSITSLFVIYVKPTKQLVRVLYLVGSRTL